MGINAQALKDRAAALKSIANVTISGEAVAAMLVASKAFARLDKSLPPAVFAAAPSIMHFQPEVPVDRDPLIEVLAEHLSTIRVEIADGPLAKHIDVSLRALAEVLGVAKSSWSDEFIAALPNTAFAVMRKDKKGTVTARFCPHHPTGKNSRDHKSVDTKKLAFHLQHLPLYVGMTDTEKRRAKSHLLMHARALGLTEQGRAPVSKLELMPGEDYYDFRDALEEAAYDMVHAMSLAEVIALFGEEACKNRDGQPDYPSLNVSSVFNDFAILEAYYSGSGYWKVPFARAADGTITLAASVRVERVTTFQPVAAEKVAKAQWTAAYINNLPDASFAFIGAGGTKDDAGKTTPRSLRSFPHHGPSVTSATDDATVDLPHLRNALARVPQSSLSDVDKAKALKHLQAHAKNLLTTEEPAQKIDGSSPVVAHFHHSEVRKDGEIDERFVLGVVLEPNDGSDGQTMAPDSDGDVYSAEEIRKACYSFAFNGMHRKVQHTQDGTMKLLVVENYIAPQDIKYPGSDAVIKAGSWVMGAKILDDALWVQVKAGTFNAWSIGGGAVQTPMAEAA